MTLFFIPERKTDTHGHIVGPGFVNIELIRSGAFVAQRNHVIGYGDNAGIIIHIAATTVYEDIAKLGILLFCISSQITPAVIHLTHQRIFLVNSVLTFHEIVDLRQRHGTLS